MACLVWLTTPAWATPEGVSSGRPILNRRSVTVCRVTVHRLGALRMLKGKERAGRGEYRTAADATERAPPGWRATLCRGRSIAGCPVTSRGVNGYVPKQAPGGDSQFALFASLASTGATLTPAEGASIVPPAKDGTGQGVCANPQHSRVPRSRDGRMRTNAKWN